jgi:hypothetical protein
LSIRRQLTPLLHTPPPSSSLPQVDLECVYTLYIGYLQEGVRMDLSLWNCNQTL